MRERRIDNEWTLLEQLQQANPDRLQLTRNRDHFALEVHGLPALPLPYTALADPIDRHALRAVFPRYYPSMPVEIYLDVPVFHPNVHPHTGFVCLWTKHRVATTLEQTLAQLQRVLSWSLLNPQTEHVMQPDALLWHTQNEAGTKLPLSFIPFIPVHAEAWAPQTAPMRRRLS